LISTNTVDFEIRDNYSDNLYIV